MPTVGLGHLNRLALAVAVTSPTQNNTFFFPSTKLQPHVPTNKRHTSKYARIILGLFRAN